MTITKFVHSCVLAEVNSKRILIDPGIYTWQSGQLGKEHLSNLDYCAITHEHPDHYYPEAIKQVLALSPNVKIKAGLSVVELMKQEGITADSNNDEMIKLDEGDHALVLDKQKFQNTKITVNNQLLHVGDSMDATESPYVLAVPIFGPWLNGTLSDAGILIDKLQPKYVIPIHDWHYKEEVRMSFITRLEEYFKPKGITVVGAELGKPYTIDI